MKFDNNLAFDLTKKGLTMNKTMEKTAKILEQNKIPVETGK